MPLHEDPRGALIPVEAADVPFPIARIFVVVGTAEGSTRGGHAVPCREMLVLVHGRAVVRISATPESEPRDVCLEQPGDCVDLPVGEWITYDLDPGPSTVMVLAGAPYEPDSM